MDSFLKFYNEANTFKTDGHYTIDGDEWTGDQHAHMGQVMTGKVHTPDSVNLYHFKKLDPKIRAKILKKIGLAEAEYQGRTVTLNDPIRTSEDPKKKFKVYVKNEKDNVVVVRFGDPNMDIKRDDPKRLKAFRARFSCDDDPGPKYKAKYWSCYQWRASAPVDN